MTRRTSRLLVGVPVVALLAGCASPLPEPAPDPVPATPPAAVTQGQAEAVVVEVVAGLTAADEQRDVSAAGPRLEGPAATMREAEYVFLGAGREDALTVLPETQTLVTPATDAWPRTIMAVTRPPEDLQPPRLITLVQDGPRDPYALWGWVRLFPGTQMPPTAQPEIGSAPVAADAADLAVSPQEALERYLDVLANGDGSSFVGSFTGEDRLRAEADEARQTYGAATIGTGVMAWAFRPAGSGPHALRTADGGALVMAAFDGVTTIALEDSTLRVLDRTAALLGGDPEVSSRLEIIWAGTVAFYVPPAGSDAPVQVLGGEFAPIQATGE